MTDQHDDHQVDHLVDDAGDETVVQALDGFGHPIGPAVILPAGADVTPPGPPGPTQRIGPPIERPDPAPASSIVRPLEALRTSGLLWALNRCVLHPRGFALGLHYPDGWSPEQIERHEVGPDGWVLYGDGSSVWTYGAGIDEDALAGALERLLDGARPTAPGRPGAVPGAPWPGARYPYQADPPAFSSLNEEFGHP